MAIIINPPGDGSYVVSFTDYRPPPRFDGLPWTHIQLVEASSSGGTALWTVTVPLDPIDEDPAVPAGRDLTVTGATLVAGWYQATFLDEEGNQHPASWVLNGPTYLPTVDDVARLLRARTRGGDAGLTTVGTFDATTTPTRDEVMDLIQIATEDVATQVGAEVPDSVTASARRLVALGTAMLIELSYFPEQTQNGQSPYEHYKELYDDGLPRLVAAASAAGDTDAAGTVGGYTSVPITSPTLAAQAAAYDTTGLLP